MPTPRRDRIEKLLEFDEQESLEEWQKYRRVRPDTWPTHPDARAWVDLAVERAIERCLKARRARSRTQALVLACADLGLSADAIRKRWQRRRQAA